MPLIEFHSPAVFDALTGIVDAQNYIIRGISLITGNIPAEGHEMDVDGTTVTQLHAMAKKRGKVPVLLDHGAGVKDLNGFVDNFRMDGDKLRGDWHLLKAHSESPLMLERAEVMPECFGFSAAFKGKGVMQKNHRKAARAEKLLSFDCVVRPAANASLFSEENTAVVDTQQIVMPKQPAANEPTLQDILTEIQGLRSEHEAFKTEVATAFGQLSTDDPTQGNESDFDVLTRLNGASDEDLTALNLTRAEVDAAVAQYNQGVQADDAEAAQADPANPPTQQTQATQQSQAAVAGESTTAQAFKALQQELLQLKAAFNKKEQIELAAKEEATIGEINEKITLLATQRDQLVQFSERALAEIDALRLANKTGTRAARGSGSETGATLKLFSANDEGELHPWQAKVKAIQLQQKVEEADAILLADKDDNGALHRDYLITLGQRQNGTITT